VWKVLCCKIGLIAWDAYRGRLWILSWLRSRGMCRDRSMYNDALVREDGLSFSRKVVDSLR